MGELPAWASDKAARKARNSRSGRHERDVAKDVGGRVQPGSGSSWRAKGDVKNGTHLIEHKFTNKESYAIKRKTWKNICDIAVNQGRIPALVIHFDEGTNGECAVVITAYDPEG